MKTNTHEGLKQFAKKRDIIQTAYDPLIFEKAGKIKLIAMDVDGVLTNGDIIIRESGEEVKTWNVKDRIGFYFARLCGNGLKFAWITGRASRQVEQQAESIKIDALYQNCMDKKQALQNLMERFSLSADEIAFIGDDLIDLPVLCRVGLSICPHDASFELKEYVDVVSAYAGGKGVFREAVELVLRATGVWEQIIAEYVKK